MKFITKRLDYTILLIIICFMAISTIVIYSATMGTKYEGLHINNLIMYICLFIPMLVVANLDYRVIVQHFSYPLYGLGVCLLLFVKFEGMNINGSARWINLGVMQFQPSELVKIFVILIIAKMLKGRNGEPLRFIKDILPIIIITSIPTILILMQPDMGTAIVFFSILIGMLWMGNMRWIHIFIGIITVVTSIAILTALYFVNMNIFSIFIKPHQLGRIQTFLDPTADPDKSWHVLNSIKAIGAGQMYGEGFGKGVFIHKGFIPYDYADSIFVVIGEEFGFMGIAILLLLYFLLIYRMIRIAMESSDMTGTYIVIGVISMLTLQIFENIAMHTGLMPLTGIALPFISYGGSSLLTYLLLIGLVLSVKKHQ